MSNIFLREFSRIHIYERWWSIYSYFKLSARENGSYKMKCKSSVSSIWLESATDFLERNSKENANIHYDNNWNFRYAHRIEILIFYLIILNEIFRNVWIETW